MMKNKYNNNISLCKMLIVKYIRCNIKRSNTLIKMYKNNINNETSYFNKKSPKNAYLNT